MTGTMLETVIILATPDSLTISKEQEESRVKINELQQVMELVGPVKFWPRKMDDRIHSTIAILP